MDAAKCFVDVTAGIIPGTVMAEHSKRWVVTGSDWEAIRAGDTGRWERVIGEAVMYSTRLMDPGRLNWVRLDWVWL